MLSGGFSKLGDQGEAMDGAPLIPSLEENWEKKCTDWMVDRQVKLTYMEVKVGDVKKIIPFKPCLHLFTPEWRWQAENTQSVAVQKLIVTMGPNRE